MAARSAAAVAQPHDSDVVLPPTYMLRRRHVEAALIKRGLLVRSPFTMWVHCSTLGIEEQCFAFEGVAWMRRILVWGADAEPQSCESAAVLGALVAKLGAYEPDLVDKIHGFVTHDGSVEMHRIGDNAFDAIPRNISWRCGLSEVVLPRSITHLGRGAFYECSSLASVTLPDSLTHVGDFAFFGCFALKSVTLPNSVTNVGASAFSGCSALTSVVLPNSLTRIDSQAFRGCKSLKEVTLPDSLTHLGAEAFGKCFQLVRVTMPAVRPFVGRDAFWKCPWRDDGAEPEPTPPPLDDNDELAYPDWDE
jgi:hypothetical protein